MSRRKRNDLQETIEEALTSMFAAAEAPDEARMKLLNTAIKYLAVKNKLEESEFGEFFANDGDTSGIPEKPARPKSAARRRENGAGSGAGAGASET